MTQVFSPLGAGVSDRDVERPGLLDVLAHLLALGFAPVCHVVGRCVETIEPRQEVRGGGRRMTRGISDRHVDRTRRGVRVDVHDAGMRRVVPGAEYQPAAPIDRNGALEKSPAGGRLWI